MSEIDCLARALIRAESTTASVFKAEQFVKEQRARQVNMSEVANHIKDAPNTFFLTTIVELLKGDQEQILDRVTEKSYAAHAALHLLFYPDLGQVG